MANELPYAIVPDGTGTIIQLVMVDPDTSCDACCLRSKCNNAAHMQKILGIDCTAYDYEDVDERAVWQEVKVND